MAAPSFLELIRTVGEILDRKDWAEALSFLQSRRKDLAWMLDLPPAPDPVGLALHLGRQALWHLMEGDCPGARKRLRRALELHPTLARGEVFHLLRRLQGFCPDPSLDAFLSDLEERLSQPPSPLTQVARFLSDLPQEVWAEFFKRKD